MTRCRRCATGCDGWEYCLCLCHCDRDEPEPDFWRGYPRAVDYTEPDEGDPDARTNPFTGRAWRET